MQRKKVRPCILIPTYNNAPTLESVLSGLQNQPCPVIIVNDGSTDKTEKILELFPEVTHLRHAANFGKGAALKSGFALATKLGYTHAVTIDSDGQHRTEDLFHFIDANLATPEALVIGVRQLSGLGAPFKSKLLRANSNFWIWLATGHRISDTQSGYRAYPLSSVAQLDLKTSKYDCEIELLVKLCWREVPVQEVPVHVLYGTPSPSHFRPIADSTLVAWLSCKLILRRLFRLKNRRTPRNT